MKPGRRTSPAARTPDAAAPRSDASFARHAAVIFAVALLVRLLHVWLLSRSPYFDALMGDARGYDEWARQIAGGDWIGSEVFYQAPLYPYVLGAIYALFGHSLTAVRVVQALIGAVSCTALGLAGYRFFRARVGLVAGLALALYAPAIFFDALIQKSVLDICFVSLALWLTGRLVDLPESRGTWAALGAAMGGLSLTRENALVFVAAILVWALGRQVARPVRLRGAALFLAGLAVVLLPVAARNYAVGGGFYLTTAQFGPNFYIGNNPQSDGTYMSLRFGRGAPEYERLDATELAEHALGRTLTPAEVSQYWTDKALDFITANPAAYLKLQARKVALLLNATEMIDTESQESHAEWSWVLRAGGWLGHFGILAPLALAGAVLTWRDRSRLAILYIMTIAYAASVVMFYVFARYRLPLVPLLLLFAAATVTRLAPWWRESTGAAKARLAGAVVVVAAIAFWPLLSTTEMRAISETNLAVALQADGKIEQAEAHYRRAIELQPDYAPAYNNLGVMQRAAGRVDEAIATYTRALELRGDYPDAHYNLANALLQQNRAQEAAEHFTIALKSIPDSAGVRNNLGIALAAQNRPADAVAAFRAAVAAEPKSAVAHRNLADALSEAGQVSEALAEYRIASTLDPADLSARYNYGVALLEAGRTADAIVELRAAVALSPQSVDALNNLGIALGSNGDLEGAIAQFRRALAIEPASAEARSNLDTAERARAQMGSRPR
jgi:tetratricopeptide (TPR) repeat protein